VGFFMAVHYLSAVSSIHPEVEIIHSPSILLNGQHTPLFKLEIV
jgi:hypothetical protein